MTLLYAYLSLWLVILAWARCAFNGQSRARTACLTSVALGLWLPLLAGKSILFYLYGAVDLVSLALVFFAALRLLNHRTRATRVLWHSLGLFNLLVILTYLLGYTGLFEFGYQSSAILLLVPVIILAAWYLDWAVIGWVLLVVIGDQLDISQSGNLLSLFSDAVFMLVYLIALLLSLIAYLRQHRRPALRAQNESR